MFKTMRDSRKRVVKVSLLIFKFAAFSREKDGSKIAAVVHQMMIRMGMRDFQRRKNMIAQNMESMKTMRKRWINAYKATLVC